MAEFEVGGHAYTSQKIDAVAQFGIACKLASILPVMGEFVPLVAKRMDAISAGQELPAVDPKLIEAVAKGLSSMPDDARNYVLATLMGVVYRKEGPGQLPVWDKARGKPAFPDITMVDMLKIAWEVFQDNLGSFMPAPGLTSPARPGA